MPGTFNNELLLLGNGNINLFLDGEGTMQPICSDLPDELKKLPGQSVWWSGHRSMDRYERPLIPYGRLEHSLTSSIASKECRLDTRKALASGEARYTCGSLSWEAFVHPGRNLLAFEKTNSGEKALPYALSYILAAPEKREFPEGMIVSSRETGHGADISYRFKGQSLYEGNVLFLSDGDFSLAMDGCIFTLEGTLAPSETVHFYLLLQDRAEDNLTEKDILRKGYAGWKQEHVSSWENDAFVSIGDETLEKVWDAARYHLRCVTTPWSIPTGICDSHWNGRYFAFDEYFNLCGLLASNQKELARRIPSFRRAGLDQAIFRATRDKNPETNPRIGARFPWETVETGAEASPLGYWMDHVFHMANIACGAWDVYQETLDLGFLRETAYPLIRACGNFYMNHMLYTVEGGKRIVGKCTDLERLGPDRENAFMTTCGVIYTLRILEKASEVLDVDPEIRADAHREAEALMESLPMENGQYVPYPGCPDKSIAVFAGLYPYPVISPSDSGLKPAIEGYVKQESKFGNMYAMGKGVNPWYAAWKGIVYARMDDANEAYASLRQAAATAGPYGEFWEIREDACRYRPWFTTASGTYLTAFREMLVENRDGVLHLLPAYPKGDVEFRLPVSGGYTVHLKAENYVITDLEIDALPGALQATYVLPENFKLA